MPDFGLFRVRACGVIVRNGAILLIECDEQGFGLHYNLPGGGVRHAEPITEAVRREVWEETGAQVDVGRLLLTYEALHEDEYIPNTMHHAFGLLFECHLRDGSEPCLPDQPDKFQIGLRWVALDALADVYLLPDVTRALCAVLSNDPGAPQFARDTVKPVPRL
jgi:ADP-ribose pyrophosphatase YjhB (NUDIX family)